MNKPLIGGPSRPARDLNELQPVAVGEAANARNDVEDEEAAVILECIVRRGLAEPGTQVRSRSRAVCDEGMIIAHLHRRVTQRAGAQLLGLVGFDVTEAVDDPAADFQKPRSLPGPAPAFQSARGLMLQRCATSPA